MSTVSKRILALKWRQLGDTILWTAALQALREWDPTAEIDVALPHAYLPLFASDPRFARRFGLANDGPTLRALNYEFRQRRYDLVLNFHASHGSRRLAEGAEGSLRLIHHHDRRGKNFGSQQPIVSLGEPAAATERDLNVVRTLGWNGTSPETRLFIDESWKEKARARWGTPAKPILVMGASASRLAKQWPLERFARLAELLSPRWEVLLAYETETFWRGRNWEREQILKSARLVHTPQLPDVAGLLSIAAAFVGGDSGVKHLAAALGVPTVTIFGPESVAEWHGYDTLRHIPLQKEVGCRDNDRQDPKFAWCGESICPLASHACLMGITPEEVAMAVGQLIAVQ